jgi:hypothetical protein
MPYPVKTKDSIFGKSARHAAQLQYVASVTSFNTSVQKTLFHFKSVTLSTHLSYNQNVREIKQCGFSLNEKKYGFS